MATKKIACVGDSSSHGGYVSNSNCDETVKADGVVVAVHGASHTCPIEGHGTTSISAITTKTKVNGKLVLTEGAAAGCGAVIQPSDRKVYCE